ncbi:thioredoxin-like protein [Hypoxylon sp. FL0543]|nr:thioredoxin-like protein [Hypoxylon sp. FL0543]
MYLGWLIVVLSASKNGVGQVRRTILGTTGRNNVQLHVPVSTAINTAISPSSRLHYEMDTLTYIFLAFTIFIVARAIFADRSPIPETSGKVYKIINAAQLDGLLSSTTHVVVDFYADWCPPCRAIAPTFSELADKYSSEGKLAFAKVNVDHVDNVALRYGVSAMPTFLFFQNGVPKGVSVKPPRPSNSTADVFVERIRGADRGTLQAVVQALADMEKLRPSN